MPVPECRLFGTVSIIKFNVEGICTHRDANLPTSENHGWDRIFAKG